MKFKRFNFKTVNSTNDKAINIIKKSNYKFGLILAEKQKRGRGQYGKKWITYKGNLFVSIFFSLEKVNLTIKQLSLINGKLVIKLLSNYYKKNIKLKLPNDILINKKKICGILQEIIIKNDIKFLIIGIGINLVKNPNIRNYPTTNLFELTSKKININDMCNELKKIYEKFLTKPHRFI